MRKRSFISGGFGPCSEAMMGGVPRVPSSAALAFPRESCHPGGVHSAEGDARHLNAGGYASTMKEALRSAAEAPNG